MNYTLKEVAKAVSGEILKCTDKKIDKAIIDSRKSSDGCLFVAIKGERVDGADFVWQAFESGAVAAIVSDMPKEFAQNENVDFGIILVDDTEEALSKLATWHRGNYNTTVVAVTGSAGKTTTKDMISYVVKEKFRTINTIGNMNNEIGMPLSILDINEDTEVAVIEMGMRGLKQIEALSKIAKPDIGVITNIGDAHMELLGSRSNIAMAKWELVESLKDRGLAIINGDDEQLQKLMKNAKCEVVTYGFADGNDVFATDLETTPQGTWFCANVYDRSSETCAMIQRVFSPIPGRHNVLNALAAICVGLALFMHPDEIKSGLMKMEASPMRMKIHDTKGKYTVIDDSYNANPQAMMGALSATLDFANSKRNVIAILGGMVELGDFSEEGHRLVGEYVASNNIDTLITTGSLAKTIAQTAIEKGMPEEKVHICDDNNQALELAKNLIKEKDVVLVKGSRLIGTDEIVKGLI